MEKGLSRSRVNLENAIVGLVLTLFIVIYAMMFRDWMSTGTVSGITRRVPGMDRRAEILAMQNKADVKVKIGERFTKYEGVPSAVTAEWPWFRGKMHDNISRDTTPLANSWPAGGPPVLWSVELGEGYAAPAVKHGMVYLLDYDEKAGEDALRCFSLDDGREIWRRSYRVPMKRNHGYSRTIPAVSDRHVVTIGPMCHVMCVDAVGGDLIWGMDLVADHGASVPLWYAGQCPLIDNGMAVIAIGGRELIRGVDCATGKKVFSVPNPGGWKMSHSSIVPAVIHGKKMYIYAAVGGTCGISAEKEDLGKILWQTTEWDASVIVPTPVVLEDGRIFLTAGYGAGSMMLKIERQSDTFEVQTLFKRNPRDMLACEQQTPVYYKGRLYGVMPKDAGGLAREFVCYASEGELIWSSGKERRFGLGPFMLVQDRFLVLNDDGALTMLALSGRDQYSELAHAQPLDGHDSWGPMVLVEGRLLVRDSRRMVCLDLTKQAE